MRQRIKITERQREWLEDNHEKLSFQELATHIGCCVDTLKRVLVRLELREFDAAKYTAPRPKSKTWTRPCPNCKSTKPRPRNQYFCTKCARNLGHDS